MTTYAIEQIVKHPAVSRAQAGIGRTPGLDILVKLRNRRRDVKRAAVNYREEVAALGPLDENSYDQGRSMGAPPMPQAAPILGRALEAGGLPAELVALIAQALPGGR